MKVAQAKADDWAVLKEIGARVRAARERAVPPYSRRELSADLGFSHNWVVRVENGSFINLSVIDVFNIANLLRVPAHQLLFGDTFRRIRRDVTSPADFKALFPDDPSMSEAIGAVWRAIQKAREERPRASFSKSTSTE